MTAQQKQFIKQLLTPTLLVVSLVFLRVNHSVLVFHTFAELFSIIVGVMMFVIVKNTRELTRNNFLTFLGIGYFWIAVLDTYHTFTMTGMLLFDSSNFEITIHFWVYTRILEALLLVVAIRYFKRELNFVREFSIVSAISIFIIWASFTFHEPNFMSETGLTTTKIAAEIFVILLLLLALYFYLRNRAYFAPKVLYFLVASIILTICAEVAFTAFNNIDGVEFVVGHLFKFLSFWMIFKAIIETSLKEPFEMMSKAFNSYDSIPHPAIVLDTNGIITRANKAALNLVHAPLEQVINQSVHDLYHPQTISKGNCTLCKSLASLNEVNGDLLYYPEYDRWYLYSLAEVTSGSTTVGMVQSLTDVTKSKQFEDELHDQKEQLRILFETTTAGLALGKMDGSLVKINQAYADIIGYGIDEALNLSYWELTPEKYKSQEAQQLKSLETKGIYGPYVKDYIHKKGHLVPVELKGCLIQQGEEQLIWSVVEDITERLDAERRLRRTEKLDAIGQLSGGIAHDFNNILGVILGNIEIIKVKESLQPESSKYLLSIERAGHRAADLANQLLDYSRKKADKLELLNIGDFILKMQNLIERSLTPDIAVTLDIAGDLDTVETSVGDFQDSLLNLIINARDAMHGRGKLTIKAHNIELDEDFCHNYPDATVGKYVHLAIVDDGIGLTLEEQEHIFEPFYTKKKDKGTGLGLAMVFNYIKHNKALISCESAPNKGATFNLYLPISNGKIIEKRIEKPILLKQGNHELILVVDDEETLLKLTVEQLELLNYQVLWTTSANEALNILEKHTGIDLLLSDIVMPGGLNGYELAEKARAIHPHIKLLLSSGYTNEKIKNAQTFKLEQPILKKPYNHTELADVLSKILN